MSVIAEVVIESGSMSEPAGFRAALSFCSGFLI